MGFAAKQPVQLLGHRRRPPYSQLLVVHGAPPIVGVPDVLLAVRLTGAVVLDVEAQSPFATESPSTDVIANRVMAGAEHVIDFHVVTEGTCWAEMSSWAEPPIHLSAGDIVVFRVGDANIMASALGTLSPKLPETITSLAARRFASDRCPSCISEPANPRVVAWRPRAQLYRLGYYYNSLNTIEREA